MKRQTILTVLISLVLGAVSLVSLAEDAKPPVTDEQRARAKETYQQWIKKIQGIANAYLKSFNMKKFREGEVKILAIDDPAAIAPLIEVLYKQSVRQRSVLLKSMVQFSSKGHEMVQVSLQEIAVCDGSSTLRNKAIGALKKVKKGNRTDRLLKHLSADAVPVARNRAAHALAVLGEKRAIPYLIDALVTEETRTAEEDYNNFTMRLTTRDTAKQPWIASEPVYFPTRVAGGKLYYIPHGLLLDPATTLSLGPRERKKTEDRVVLVKHRVILSALRKLTKKNYGYDQIAWRRWLKANRGKLPAWRPLK